MAKQVLIETIMVQAHRPGLTESAQGPSYITEKSATGALVIKLPVTTLNKKNENGRVYRTAIMEGAIRNCESDIKARKLFCTVDDHLEDVYVAPGNASHIVTRAWVEGEYLWNEWEVLETANGNNLRALVKAETSFGVSIRGLGSMDNQGNILEDYEYLGTDCVGNPSARIWAKPEIVTGLPTTRNESRPLSESNTKPGASKMMTFDEAVVFINEQVVLMKNESDKINAFKRAATVESKLSELQIAPQQIAKLYSQWDAAKTEIFKNAPKTENNEELKQAKARNESLLNRLNTASKLMNGELKKVATEKRQLAGKIATLEKAAGMRITALRNTLKQHVAASTAMKTKLQKTETLLGKTIKMQNDKLKSESLKNRGTSLKVKRLEKQLATAVKEAAKATRMYNEACVHAAAATKVAIRYAESAKPAPVTESAPAPVATPPAPKKIDVVKPVVTEQEVRVPHFTTTGSSRNKKHVTEGTKNRDHKIPGML